jgi:hypothetical protein
MAILTKSGRAAMAASIKAQEIHLAWGSGDAAWDASPVPEPVTATGLVAEIGRRRVTQAQFCLPDTSGSIRVPEGRFEPSATPTNYLFLRFMFDYEDAPTAVIREIAVFVGTELDPSVPVGQDYVDVAQVVDPGQLLTLERPGRINRSSTVRQQFEQVIQF